MEAPALTVSPNGAVRFKAHVGELQAEGELSGEFDADVVKLSGKVQDRTIIRAKTLERAARVRDREAPGRLRGVQSSPWATPAGGGGKER